VLVLRHRAYAALDSLERRLHYLLVAPDARVKGAGTMAPEK